MKSSRKGSLAAVGLDCRERGCSTSFPTSRTSKICLDSNWRARLSLISDSLSPGHLGHLSVGWLLGALSCLQGASSAEKVLLNLRLGARVFPCAAEEKRRLCAAGLAISGGSPPGPFPRAGA